MDKIHLEQLAWILQCTSLREVLQALAVICDDRAVQTRQLGGQAADWEADADTLARTLARIRN